MAERNLKPEIRRKIGRRKFEIRNSEKKIAEENLKQEIRKKKLVTNSKKNSPKEIWNKKLKTIAETSLNEIICNIENIDNGQIDSVW